jgi:ribosomal protein S18 acetylase RimI-like enzyme
MPIVKAAQQHIAAIVTLVNSAYRGESSKKGWTTEADILPGNERTDASLIQAIINDPLSCLLLYILPNGQLAGTVHLQQQPTCLYLGMLSVDPELQAKGIGKQLLQAAENHARHCNCPAIKMTVISSRTTLVDWYNRHGYHSTGNRLPFIADGRFNQSAKPLEFEILIKPITDYESSDTKKI